MELEMLALTKRVSIATAFVLALSMSPLAALAAPASLVTSIDARSASTFQRGDLVRLRSGGPLMTINRIKGDQVDCFWTDFNGQPNDATFPADVLQNF
jgi:uncharacterized protein YodC (DUF2158 family)